MNPPAFPDFISHELSKRVFKKDTAARYGSGWLKCCHSGYDCPHGKKPATLRLPPSSKTDIPQWGQK